MDSTSEQLQRDRVSRLASFGCTDIVSGTLTLTLTSKKAPSFLAVLYKQTFSRGIDILGDPPAVLLNRRCAIVLDGYNFEWYLAAHMTSSNLAALSPEQKAFHPHGPHFMLGEWDLPSGEKIDAHYYWRGEKHSYLRIKGSLLTGHSVPSPAA